MVEYDAQLETSTPAHLFCTIIELAFHCYELFVKWSLLTVASRGSIVSVLAAFASNCSSCSAKWIPTCSTRLMLWLLLT